MLPMLCTLPCAGQGRVHHGVCQPRACQPGCAGRAHSALQGLAVSGQVGRWLQPRQRALGSCWVGGWWNGGLLAIRAEAPAHKTRCAGIRTLHGHLLSRPGRLVEAGDLLPRCPGFPGKSLKQLAGLGPLLDGGELCAQTSFLNFILGAEGDWNTHFWA
jgi:hypothetical protein